MREALNAARSIYGDLQKGNGGIKSASKFATDKDVQEQLRRALEDLGKASERLKGKKKSHRGRNTLLLAGLIVGRSTTRGPARRRASGCSTRSPARTSSSRSTRGRPCPNEGSATADGEGRHRSRRIS